MRLERKVKTMTTKKRIAWIDNKAGRAKALKNADWNKPNCQGASKKRLKNFIRYIFNNAEYEDIITCAKHENPPLYGMHVRVETETIESGETCETCDYENENGLSYNGDY